MDAIARIEPTFDIRYGFMSFKKLCSLYATVTGNVERNQSAIQFPVYTVGPVLVPY